VIWVPAVFGRDGGAGPRADEPQGGRLGGGRLLAYGAPAHGRPADAFRPLLGVQCVVCGGVLSSDVFPVQICIVFQSVHVYHSYGTEEADYLVFVCGH